MDRLRPYLEHGILERDNNAAEQLADTLACIPDYKINKIGELNRAGLLEASTPE